MRQTEQEHLADLEARSTFQHQTLRTIRVVAEKAAPEEARLGSRRGGVLHDLAGRRCQVAAELAAVSRGHVLRLRLRLRAYLLGLAETLTGSLGGDGVRCAAHG